MVGRIARSLSVLLVFTAFSVSCAAGYSLTKITVSGSKRFSEGDIIAATGLKPGSIVTAEDLKRAADRLTESGVFAHVNYSFDGASATYTVVDAEAFVPASFENFVWFTDSELVSSVHNTVPLFSGTVPLTGNLSDQVCTALDSVLKQKGISGHALAKPIPAKDQMQAIQFLAVGVKIDIGDIQFPGAAPERLNLLRDAAKNLIGSTYSKSLTAALLRQACLRVYGKLGFLKAKFGVPVTTVINGSSSATVRIDAPVEEGDAFLFSTADWTGNKTIPLADLVRLVDLKQGTEADSVRLAGDIAAAKDLYASRGYMYAQIKSSATLDVSNHTAAFHLAVDEGPLYHMGKLELQNLDPERTEQVRRFWGLHEGDVYDASYPKVFLKTHPRELPSLNGWAAIYTQTIHDDTLAVDLVLKFQKLQESK